MERRDRNPFERPNNVVVQVLENRQFLNKFLKAPQDHPLRLYLEKHVRKFNYEESTVLAVFLVRGMAKDDPRWDRDRKKGALELLKLMPLEKAYPEKLQELYDQISAYQNGQPDSPYHALVQARKVIAPAVRENVQDVFIAKPVDTRSGKVTSDMEEGIGQKKIDGWLRFDIAEFYGVSQVTVSKVLRKLGLVNIRQRDTEGNATLKRLYKAGLPYKDIGSEMGINASAVGQRVYKMIANGELERRSSRRLPKAA